MITRIKSVGFETRRSWVDGNLPTILSPHRLAMGLCIQGRCLATQQRGSTVPKASGRDLDKPGCCPDQPARTLLPRERKGPVARGNISCVENQPRLHESIVLESHDLLSGSHGIEASTAIAFMGQSGSKSAIELRQLYQTRAAPGIS